MSTPNMQEAGDWRDTAGRLFRRTGFTLAWVAFLAAFVTIVGWRIRSFVVVSWVLGTRAYFQEGIRVLKGHPLRFSNGQLVPTGPDVAITFGVFFLLVLGLTMLLIFAVCLYERRVRNRPSTA
jgi:hypothetical protein